MSIHDYAEVQFGRLFADSSIVRSRWAYSLADFHNAGLTSATASLPCVVPPTADARRMGSRTFRKAVT